MPTIPTAKRPPVAVDSTNVPDWLWPLIWADLNDYEAVKSERESLNQEVGKLKLKSRADSLARPGANMDCVTCKQLLPAAQEAEKTALKGQIKWQNKYRAANTERWLERGTVAGLGYLLIRSLLFR